ncbi:MAG TPA: response regulator [Nitrososphaeraceae archaeon]|nr:response regulator [Nitrososphaeraceae archaeon]
MQNSGRIVCIVDDDFDIAQLFRDALTILEGVRLFTFTDPILALEHIQINESAYSLVISDYRMPSLNGMELLKKTKDLNPYVRTILMTAFATDDQIFRAYIKKKIINAFLQKPIRIHDLIMEVDTQLHKYETQKCFPAHSM